jgi:hypothetical protein
MLFILSHLLPSFKKRQLFLSFWLAMDGVFSAEWPQYLGERTMMMM